MKKFIAEYLKISPNGTLREKVLFARIALSLTAVVFCLAAMSYSACAYFAASVSSNANKIVAANFELDYTIATVGNENEEVLPNADGTYTLARGEYVLNVEKQVSAVASTGFCKIEIVDLATGEMQTFYSQQFGIVSPDVTVPPVNERSILIDIEADNVCVKLTSSWGTCAKETILNDALSFEITVPSEPIVETEQDDEMQNGEPPLIEPDESDRLDESDELDETDESDLNSDLDLTDGESDL